MSEAARLLKTRHAVTVRALHADILRSPGGFQALAAVTGRPANSLSNAFNPNDQTCAPTAELMLTAIEHVQSFGAVSVQAQAIGYSLLPLPAVDDAGGEVGCLQPLLRQVVKETGDVLTHVGEAIGQTALPASKRAAISKDVDEAIQILSRFRTAISG